MGKPLPAWKQRALAAVDYAEQQKLLTEERQEAERQAKYARRKEAHWRFFIKRLDLKEVRPPFEAFEEVLDARWRNREFLDSFQVDFDGYRWRVSTSVGWNAAEEKNNYMLQVCIPPGNPGGGVGWRSCGKNDEQLGRAIQYLEEQRVAALEPQGATA